MQLISRIWTNVIKDNLLPFIIFNLIFIGVLSGGISKVLTHFQNKNNESVFVHEVTLNLNGAILLIPFTMLLSLGMVIIWIKFSERFLPSSTLNKIGSGTGITLKWLFKSIFFVAKWLVIGIALFIMLIVNWVSPSGSSTHSRSSRTADRLRANRITRHKLDVANHALKNANRQARHNPNSHRMRSRYNEAGRALDEVDKAVRRERNL